MFLFWVKIGLKLGFKVLTSFSLIWELTTKTGIEKKKQRTKRVFTWKPEAGSQGIKQILFIGSSCSSSHMGLMLLAPLVLLLTEGCYSSPLAFTSFLLLLLLFFHYYSSLFIAITYSFFDCYNSSLIITFLSLLLLLFSHGVVLKMGCENRLLLYIWELPYLKTGWVWIFLITWSVLISPKK
jgi:hypothetical protein